MVCHDDKVGVDMQFFQAMEQSADGRIHELRSFGRLPCIRSEFMAGMVDIVEIQGQKTRPLCCRPIQPTQQGIDPIIGRQFAIEDRPFAGPNTLDCRF